MFSGKTEELIRRLRRAQIARQTVVDPQAGARRPLRGGPPRLPLPASESRRSSSRNSARGPRAGARGRGDRDRRGAVPRRGDRRGLRAAGRRGQAGHRGRARPRLPRPPFEPMPAAPGAGRVHHQDPGHLRRLRRTRRAAPSGWCAADERILVGSTEFYEARCRGCFEPPEEAVTLFAVASRAGRMGGRRVIGAAASRVARVARAGAALGGLRRRSRAARARRPSRSAWSSTSAGSGDKSFNDSAYAGPPCARSEELGITFEYFEPGEGTDREAALRLLRQRGAELIIGVGFLFTDDIETVAREYPGEALRLHRLHLDRGEAGPAEPGRAQVPRGGGLVPGRRDRRRWSRRRGTVGFVGGMDIPLIHKFEAGYRAGVLRGAPGRAGARQLRRASPATRSRTRRRARSWRWRRYDAGRRRHLPRLRLDRPRRLRGGAQRGASSPSASTPTSRPRRPAAS